MANSITATDVEQAIATIEEVLGPQNPDSYAHSFGDAPATATFGLRSLRYIKPADIQSDPQVSVVFFKMSLSTGWDCPRAEVVMSFRVAEDDDYIAQLVGRMVRNPLARRIESDEVLNSVALYLPKYDRKAVQDIVARLRAGDPDFLPSIDAEEGDGLVTCDRDEELFDRIKSVVATLPTYVVPRRRRMLPIPRLERLAGALSDYEIRPDAPKEMDKKLIAHIWRGFNARRCDAAIRQAVDRARKVGLDATTLSYLTGHTESRTIELTSTSQSIERHFEHVGARVGAGLHEKLWRAIRFDDPSIDGDQARLLVIATLGNDAIIAGAEDIARNLFDNWDTQHRNKIEQLSDTGRLEFEQLDEHADEPRQRHLALPLTVRSRRSPKTTDWPHHLYTDADRNFPEDPQQLGNRHRRADVHDPRIHLLDAEPGAPGLGSRPPVRRRQRRLAPRVPRLHLLPRGRGKSRRRRYRPTWSSPRRRHGESARPRKIRGAPSGELWSTQDDHLR